MTVLCVVVLFVVISSDVIATSEAEFYGRWTVVQYFGDPNEPLSDDIISLCVSDEFIPGETKCTCNGVKVFNFKALSNGDTISANITGAIANTHEEAIHLARRCLYPVDCGIEFKVFRKLDDNYFISYFSAKNNETPNALLLAKSVPSLKALDTFVSSINDFNDKAKTTICVNNSTT